MAQQVPSTKEVQQTLQQVKEEISATGKQTEGLDATGKKILADTKEVVTTAQQFVAEKYSGDKVKKLVKETQLATEELQEHAQRLQEMQTETLKGIDSEKLRRLAEDTLRTARLAGTELISSQSFRQSCLDFLNLVTDILGEATAPVVEEGKQKATETIAQGEQKLKETLTQGEQKLKETVGHERVEAMKDVVGRDNIEKMKQVGQENIQKMKGVTQTTPTGVQPMEAYRYQTPTSNVGTSAPAAATDVKETAEEYVNKGLEMAGFESRVELTQDQVDALYNRFMEIVRQVSDRERTKKVFQGFIEIFTFIREQAQETGEQLKEHVEQTTEALQQSEHLNKALKLSQEVFEQFTGIKSLDPLMDHFVSLKDILANDQETSRYFGELRNYLGKIFDNPDLLNDQQFIEKGKRLIRRGREINNKKVYSELIGIRRELNSIIENVQNDPLTLKLKDSMQKLVSDLVLDSDGNITWKPEVMEQLRLILVSSIVDRMKIPLPAVHVEDENVEYTLSGLVLSLKHLLPEKIGIESRGKAVFDLSEIKDPAVSGAGHALRITLENINVFMPDSYLWFRRKTFPRIEDEGRAHIEIGGRGLDIVVVLRTFLRSDKLFAVASVNCNIHNLEFSLSDTQHDFLYNTLIKMFSGTVKADIESSIENTLTNNLEQLNIIWRQQMSTARNLTQGTNITETVKQGISQTLGTAF